MARTIEGTKALHCFIGATMPGCHDKKIVRMLATAGEHDLAIRINTGYGLVDIRNALAGERPGQWK
jgi:hypothetical protein